MSPSFDPARPHTTRMGLTPSGLRRSIQGFTGHLGGVEFHWRSSGRWLSDDTKTVLDLVNRPSSKKDSPMTNAAPTVAPTSAGDMAGEDDAALAERTLAFLFEKLGASRGLDNLAALAREGARREPVAGDGWQPISTAPKDGTRIIGADAETVRETDWVIWLLAEVHQPSWRNFSYSSPTHWRPLPAAPSPVPSDTGGEPLTSKCEVCGFPTHKGACTGEAAPLPSTAPTRKERSR